MSSGRIGLKRGKTMEVKELIKQYLAEAKLMQLATAKNNKPWICSVWYVHDENFNLYWDSKKTRAHSMEIMNNPYVAGAIVKPHTQGRGERVQGLQFEGTAEMVPYENIKKVHTLYFKKYTLMESKSLDEFTDNDAPTAFFVAYPKRMVLFDEINFPNEPRQELVLNS